MTDELLLIDYEVPDTPSDPALVAEIPKMYISVLDNLLTLPHVKDNLVEGSPPSRGPNSSLQWGKKSNILLENISRSKHPDIQWLADLKAMLSAANDDFMTAFVQADGVAILIQAVNTRLNRPSLSEYDIALLYEATKLVYRGIK
eukprot:gene22111-23161_t